MSTEPTVSIVAGGTATGTATGADGQITYTPTVAEVGTTVTVKYQLCPIGSTTTPPCDTATLSIGVALPPPPVATDATSTGTGTDPQSTTVPIPFGGSVTLLDGSTAVNTVTISGQGTYTLDTQMEVITFVPEVGFVGAATPVTFRISDALGQSDDATYTPNVVAPTTTSTTTSTTSTSVTTTSTPASAGVTTATDGSGTSVPSTTGPSSTTLARTGVNVVTLLVVGSGIIAAGLLALGARRRLQQS